LRVFLAKRDKLTHRQKRQVAHKQAQRLKKSKALPALSDLSEAKQGLLLSRFGEQADILDLSDSKRYRCYLRQNLGSPVSGDRVSFRLAANDQGIVEAVEERTSILERPAQHQGVKPVVANISRIFVVIAPLPDFSAALLDRYLVAVRQANIDVCIVANKWDLVDEIKQQKISEQLAIYQKLGYSVTFVSTKTNQGIDDLKQLACHHQSILVGQSGVGKSSLINQLFPDQSSLVNTISSNSRLGQHTTTASKLFLFDQQNQENLTRSISFIIDSPGIREFGLWHMSQTTIADGFIEFEDYLGSCKFRDCQHVNEPGCEIITAVKQDKIDIMRWQSYCKIVTEPGNSTN
jgi:ribosome biogenesis GTPase / thiamine phosphate phosphatase